MLILVRVLEGFHRRIGVATLFEDQFGQRVARARCFGRAVNRNRQIRQRRIDVLPRFGRIGFAERLFGKRLVDVQRRQGQARATRGLCKGNAIKPDLDFDNVFHAIFGAVFIFRFLDPARGVFDVRILGTHTGAKQLHARARAG